MADECVTRPKSFKDPGCVAARLARLAEPHVAPLTALVHELRAEVGDADGVPYFDPADGGVRARVLLLLEAPGRMAAKGSHRGGSGIVSCNNDDESARATIALLEEARLPRERIVVWNIVPWYVGDEERRRIRAPKSAELARGVVCLRRLLALLPDLRVVVTLGAHARRGWAAAPPAAYPHLRTLATGHTSPLALRRDPSRREHLLRTLIEARELAGT